MPLDLWDHVFQSMVFIINRLPPASPPHISPFSKLFNKKPDYTFFRVIGCLCYPLIRPYNSHKLQFRSLPKDFPSNFLTVAKHTDLSNLAWAPLRFRVPWNVALGRAQDGNSDVAGDAMHPMTPDLAQGGCSALEDAVVLARCLSQAHTTAADDKLWVEKGLKRYVDERRWRVTGLIAGSWLSGWVQQSGCGAQKWWSGATRWFRDRCLYKFVLPWLMDLVWKDCGDLSSPVK